MIVNPPNFAKHFADVQIQPNHPVQVRTNIDDALYSWRADASKEAQIACDNRYWLLRDMFKACSLHAVFTGRPSLDITAYGGQWNGGYATVLEPLSKNHVEGFVLGPVKQFNPELVAADASDNLPGYVFAEGEMEAQNLSEVQLNIDDFRLAPFCNRLRAYGQAFGWNHVAIEQITQSLGAMYQKGVQGFDYA